MNVELRPIELEWMEWIRRSIEREASSPLFHKSLFDNEDILLNKSLSQSTLHKSTVCIPSTSSESLSVPPNEFRSSLSSMNSSSNSSVEHFTLSLPDSAFRSLKNAQKWKPPSDSKPQNPLLRRIVGKRNAALRHSIRVNDDEEAETEEPKNDHSPTLSMSSADSGQCSGASPPKWDFSTSLPCYSRIAAVMDHVLRTASALHTLLDFEHPQVSRELFHKTAIYVQIIRRSTCGPFFCDEDIDLVVEAMKRTEENGFMISDHFVIVVRRMLEQTLLVFARVIATYLGECVNTDRLLPIALEHFVHLLLFGDEICLEAIRWRSVDHIVAFCRMLSTSARTLKLLLRSLSVLCGVQKGCIHLISINGLNAVLEHLRSAPSECAVEAAGVLTQLTNPGHSVIRLRTDEVIPLLTRLLELVDECVAPEALLLSVAAISNLSFQNSKIVEILYQRNAVLRLVRSLDRDKCSNVFVQEQIVTVFSHLSLCGHEQVLIAQGAIPVLLQMLTNTEVTKRRMDYVRRVQYKAAVCLATLASGTGLKAIHQCNGIEVLQQILQTEYKAQQTETPFTLICSSLKQRIQSTFPLETFV